jgi:hypothetical protein
MRKEVHVQIAKELFKKLNLPKNYEKVFIRAVVEPDRWRRRHPRYKHHYLQYYTILDYVKRAREAYINGYIQACLQNLGIALHFIQDAFIPSPRTRELRKSHQHLEGKVASFKGETLFMLRNAIDEGFMVSVSSPKFIENVLSNIRWIYDEDEVLKCATKTSAMITAAVFGPKDPPSGLREKYRMLKEEHDKRISKASIISLISAIIGLTLTILLENIYLLPIFFFIIPILIYAGILSDDEEFYEVKEEASWYGIK